MSQQNVLLLLLVQLLELRRLQHFGVDLHDPLGKGCHAAAGAAGAGVADDGGVDDFLFTRQNNSATATLRTRTTAKNKENKDQFHISKKKEDESLIFFSMSRSRRRLF